MTKKSQIFTPEPHYLPKYTGYLPQYKYRIGKTYGRHSVEILTDENVKKSGKVILTPLGMNQADTGVDQRKDILSKRQVPYGNQNLVYDMLPGYTGYIPKNQHYFARRYADVCRSAISQHEVEQQEHNNYKQQLRSMSYNDGISDANKLMLAKVPKTPLKPITKTNKEYQSPQEFQPYTSPYSSPNTDDMKWFKTGYTGFVPRTRDLISLDYKRQCNTGLKRFNDQQIFKKKKENATDEIPNINKPEEDKPTTRIYPTDRGMLPHYTGYIPGYKYKIGHTYGRHSLNALNLSLD